MEVPVKTPSKKAATPAKATPGKKAVTPAKATPAKATPAKATPAKSGKKGATPAGAKNGKKAKKEESEDEESDESEEEEKPVAKKPAAKMPVTVAESDDDEDDDDDEEDDEDDEDNDDEELMEVAPVAKGKKAVAPKKDDDEDDENEDEDEDDDDDEEDDEDDEDDETVKESGKRKKEMPANVAAPEKKKQKTEGSEGLSVFVANLNSAKDFDELKDSLREFFTKKSLPVLDVRIGVSKKFGYVDFSSAEEVEKAIKLSGKKVLGFEVKIEKANSPAEKSKNAENKKERDARTLFLKNLPYSTGVEQLQEIFENAKDIRLPVGKDGSSKGIAYVEFGTEAEADSAIQDKQGTEIEGRSMFIDYTGEKSQNAGGRRGGPVGECKVLVVNNLAYSATEDSLQEVFEKATSIKIPQNNQGRPKGFAFVEFSSADEAKDALESCNNTEIEGRSIRIEYSQGGGPQGGRGSAQSKTLFVKGLSEDTTEETLKEAFDGSVNARIVTDRDTGTSKGFGFVDFSTTEDAKAAKEAMEDGEIDGNKVTLDFAKPKGDSRGGGRGGFGGRGGGRGGFGGRGGGRGGFGGRGGGRGGFGGRGGGRGGFGGRGGGGGFRGGNQGKKTKFDD